MFSYSQLNKQTNVLLIDKKDATPFFIASLEERSIPFVIYDEESMVQEVQKDNFLDQEKEVDTSEDLIKTWLKYNAHIKVLPKSYFNQLTQEKKELYIQSGALILKGEVITIKDIEDYENY